MSPGSSAAEAVPTFLSEALGGHARDGVKLALDLLDKSVPSDTVIVDLLGAAQREVGERWFRNQCTVADEHLATGVAQKALDALADSIEAPPESGLVVVACAEGDWHSLPAQMFAEMVRSHGFGVAFLGASTPADQAESLLQHRAPNALAISCSVPLFYNGVRSLANAAHRQGVPVIAGGRAMGTGPQRALRLGADAWGTGMGDAGMTLSAWRESPHSVSSTPYLADPAVLELEDRADGIAVKAFKGLTEAFPEMGDYDARQLARTRQDLASIVRFTAAARHVDDPSVLDEFLEWLVRWLQPRGVPPLALKEEVRSLIPLMAPIDALASRMAEVAVERLIG